MSRTAGEARAVVLEKQKEARRASTVRLIKALADDELQGPEQLALECFDDGFDAGYSAGWQAALDVMRGLINGELDAQRTAILSHWP